MLNRVANQSRVVKGVRLRSLVAAVLLLPAGLQSVSALTFAASPLQLSAGAITTELACRHLFIRLADGPKALSWNTRMAMLKNSSLSSAQIQMVIHAANAYAANTARLSREAQAIRANMKSKTSDQAVEIEALKSLDRQRDGFLAAALDQLRIDLDRDGSYRLETFLNDYVKPTIVVGR